MDEPVFYTQEAKTADVVQCRSGHLMARETALFVGEMIYAQWGCPYCTYSKGEREALFRARDVAQKGR